MEWKRLLKSPAFALAAGVIVAGAVFGGATFVQAQSSGGDVISACVNRYFKTVRIVTSNTCSSRVENFVTWNQQGPAGPAGSPGATGSPGAQGEQGPPGPAYISQATDGAQSAELSVDNITINGVKVMGDVNPGDTVAVEFDWSLPLNGLIIEQGYIGFDGGPAVCFVNLGPADGAPRSGTDQIVELTAPSTAGPHRISVLRTQNISCTEPVVATMPAVPAVGSTAAVIAVRDAGP